MEQVALAATAFVGTHFLLSHPLRAPIVRAIGEHGFVPVYALVAFATLGWLASAYRAAPMTPMLWPVGDGLWVVATVVMLVASVLLIGSLIGNPALPGGGAPAAVPAEARGVFAITRHPMMWAFALWAAAHALVYPIAANLVLVAAIAVLALVGAALQDRKKEAPSARHLAAMGSAYRLLALRRHRRGPRAVRRLPPARHRRRVDRVAGGDLGASAAGGLGGGDLALDVAARSPIPPPPPRDRSLASFRDTPGVPPERGVDANPLPDHEIAAAVA